MGREIRRVPPDWEHPKTTRMGREEFQPLYDKPFSPAAREWMDEAIAWENGTHEDAAEHKATFPFYWQWNGDPPDAAYYRPDWPEGTATAYQVYETVSEGTPVTPPCATKAKLVDYLVSHGDFWDQKAGDGGWDRTSAERFVEQECAPSLIVENFPGQAVKIMSPRDQR